MTAQRHTPHSSHCTLRSGHISGQVTHWVRLGAMDPLEVYKVERRRMEWKSRDKRTDASQRTEAKILKPEEAKFL